MGELQPPVFIGDLRIGEPTTAITDLLVAAVCFLAWMRLGRLAQFPSLGFFRLFFLFLGLATLWGGLITHAFIFYLNEPWKVPGWIMSTWAVSLLAWAMVSHHQKIIANWAAQIKLIIVVELLCVIAITVYTVQFKWAGAHSAFTLVLIVMTLALFSYRYNREKASLWMLYGIGIFLLSGLTFAARIAIHKWFNHVDLTHVFLAIAAWVIYRSVSLLKTSS